MKLCAACNQDLPKDKFSKKQWKLGAECQRRCTSCVRGNREVQLAPPLDNNNESANNNDGIFSSLESMSLNDDEMILASDEELFKQPPSREDCPICFMMMPSLETGSKYMHCCGKKICSGCILANARIDLDKQLCPFCRIPNSDSDQELVKRNKKRMKLNDADAYYNLGCKYRNGVKGLPQDISKALELWHRAGELGSTMAYNNIGNAYYNGNDVERDVKKARYYFEIAAMAGDVDARFNLGLSEKDVGNVGRALKHFMISARSGDDDSLKQIKQLFTAGHATKEDYTNALLAYQSYLDEIRSEQRNQAAEYSDRYKYY